MKQRFNQVFDQKIVKRIADSNLSQWESIGWRGIMLDGGAIWVSDKKITAVNYSSDIEQKYKQQLITAQRQKLHRTLKNFKKPELQFKTAKFQIRIDELNNGKYRYASWESQHSQATKPDLILNNGDVIMAGSGGNHYYIFKSGLYQYIIYRNILGESQTPDVILEVKKQGKTVLSQSGTLLK